MENKHVGYLILGIAVVVGIMLFFFSNTAKHLDATCPLIEEELFCPSSAALNSQIYFSMALIILLVVIGLFFVFTKPSQKIVVKRVIEKQKAKVFDLIDLTSEEKQVFKLVQSEGAMFQADIIDKTGFGKAKITRIIDRLEGKDFVERKRRGMNNLVALRD